MRRATWFLVVALSGCVTPDRALVRGAAGTAPPDFSGVWLPDAHRAPRQPVALTPAARRFQETFNPAESDPAILCMPLGTPRNMLQTQYPIEIVQTPQRLVMVIQPNLANAEVRRIPLDGRELPVSPEPSWFGTSRGHWEGSTLVIETIGLREDALIREDGLPHSRQLRVIERLRVTNEFEGGKAVKVLIDDIELHDPQAYVVTPTLHRAYSWAPNVKPRDPTCVDALWIDKLWRDRLQEHKETGPGEGSR
jgi:hypothetical protein